MPEREILLKDNSNFYSVYIIYTIRAHTTLIGMTNQSANATPPTVDSARQAKKALQQQLLQAITQYENDHGVCIDQIDLTHHFTIGYPRRVASVLVTVHL